MACFGPAAAATASVIIGFDGAVMLAAVMKMLFLLVMTMVVQLLALNRAPLGILGLRWVPSPNFDATRQWHFS